MNSKMPTPAVPKDPRLSLWTEQLHGDMNRVPFTPHCLLLSLNAMFSVVWSGWLTL